jgi:hypothetical protein
MFELLYKIDNSKIAALLFLSIYLISVSACWYWILFKDGASFWVNGVLDYQKKIGLGATRSFMTTPKFIKFFVTILLIGSIVGVFLGFSNMLKS